MSLIVKTALSACVVALLSQPSIAASQCAGVDQQLTKERKAEYAELISKNLKNKVKASAVEVDSFMQSGDWSVVYASTPVADPGYFFFKKMSGKQTFKDVWAGMADEGDGPKLIKFAESLGANKEIASCFSHVVMTD